MTVPKARVTRHDLRRYRQILGILVRYGFGDVLGRIRVSYRVHLRTRFAKKEAETLSGLSTPERLRLAFEELGPTFIKFGQILSCRPDLLPPEFIRQMSKLQDSVPPFPYGEAKAVIEAELGRPLSQLFRSMDDEPVAAASLAQVYRARMETGEEVAVKVQRPGVEAFISADIRILYELATLAERHLSDLRYYEPTRIVDEFARTIESHVSLSGDQDDAFLISQKEVRAMLFMNICMWRPEDEKEVRKRRANWKWPQGIKVIFEFLDLQGCRTMKVIDTDAKGLVASRAAWTDVLVFETFPVYPFGESKSLNK